MGLILLKYDFFWNYKLCCLWNFDTPNLYVLQLKNVLWKWSHKLKQEKNSKNHCINNYFILNPFQIILGRCPIYQFKSLSLLIYLFITYFNSWSEVKTQPWNIECGFQRDNITLVGMGPRRHRWMVPRWYLRIGQGSRWKMVKEGGFRVQGLDLLQRIQLKSYFQWMFHWSWSKYPCFLKLDHQGYCLIQWLD